jgi:hypothetical protein
LSTFAFELGVIGLNRTHPSTLKTSYRTHDHGETWVLSEDNVFTLTYLVKLFHTVDCLVVSHSLEVLLGPVVVVEDSGVFPFLADPAVLFERQLPTESSILVEVKLLALRFVIKELRVSKLASEDKRAAS